MASPFHPRRPGERRDPYAVYSRCGTRAETFRGPTILWLWVPAFAGTTGGEISRFPSSPSLPRCDDLDLVAGFQRRLRPFCTRQYVEIQCDGEMGAFIVEFAQERVDAAGNNFARFAVDGHAHCITSLSIWPRST